MEQSIAKAFAAELDREMESLRERIAPLQSRLTTIQNIRREIESFFGASDPTAVHATQSSPRHAADGEPTPELLPEDHPTEEWAEKPTRAKLIYEVLREAASPMKIAMMRPRLRAKGYGI